jgi:hypothetical protein
MTLVKLSLLSPVSVARTIEETQLGRYAVMLTKAGLGFIGAPRYTCDLAGRTELPALYPHLRVEINYRSSDC